MTRATTPRICQRCGKDFLARPDVVRRGHGKFCSYVCTGRSQTSRFSTDPAARLEARVDKSAGPDACWPWQGKRSAQGYGHVTIAKRDELTHRLAYQAVHGQIPAGMLVCHHCDNPPCCNPKHLFLGTYQDNAQDMHAKGRGPNRRGERNPSAKLSDAQAAEIRASARGVRELARIYGVAPSLISRIRSGARRAVR